MTVPLVVATDPLAELSSPLRWLVERSKPQAPALLMVTSSSTPEALCNAWMQAEDMASAIRLIAAVLPPRESIWWAWVSARHATQMAGGAPATAEVHTTLAAIERWIVRPDDEARRTAWENGNAAGLDTPVGMVAAAVFLSGTSVAPPNLPPTPPPPGATMPLVAGAILLAGSSNAVPQQILPTLAAYAAQGLEIVKRLGGWDAALKNAHETLLRQQQEYDRLTANAVPA